MSRRTPAPVPEITTEELRSRLERGEEVAVLDVRPRNAFDEWRIPGSRHVGGYHLLKEGETSFLDGASLPEGVPLVTVCAAGETSRLAARRLRERGRDARSLEGGMRGWTFAWNRAGLSLPGEGGEVTQIRRTGKGCLSYLVGSGDEALAIDPALEPRVFREEARRRGWRIVGVLETHVHADHLSRARSLAEAAGARLHLPGDGRISYPHHPLKEGDRVPVGGAVLEVLHTPGHTPESLTLRLGDGALFTGDTLFVDGVGRPDLHAGPDEGRTRARDLHRSLQRLLALPDELAVLPGHAPRPVPFDGVPVAASLGRVRETVDVLGRTREEFVREVLDRVPPTPPNYEEIVSRNESGDWPEESELAGLEAGANRCAVG